MAAAEAAIANPLLDETSMRGAKGLLISITGGRDLTLFEVDEAATRIREEVDQDANIILGATFDEELEGVIRVSVVATGIDKTAEIAAAPIAIRPAPEPVRRRPPMAVPRLEALAIAGADPVAEAIRRRSRRRWPVRSPRRAEIVPSAQQAVSAAPPAEPVAPRPLAAAPQPRSRSWRSAQPVATQPAEPRSSPHRHRSPSPRRACRASRIFGRW